MTWPCLLAEEGKGAAVVPQQQVPEAETSRSASGSGSASGLKSDAATGDTVGGQEEEKKKKKKNWDKIVDDDEEPDPSDPVRRLYPPALQTDFTD